MAFMQPDVNYLAVVVAALAAFVLGFAWYSQKGFGNKWMKLSGITAADMKKAKNKSMAGPMALGLLGQLVTAYFLANVVLLSGASTLGEGLAVGFWVWLGFIATLTLGSVLWERKPWALYYLNNGYNLLNFLVMAAIIAVWQ